MVQVELGAIVPLFKVTEVPPLTAVSEAEAPHPLNEGDTGFARKTFAGRLSVNEACVNVVLESLLLITMDSWLISPAHIVLELKLLRTEGGRRPPTCKVALAGLVLVMLPPPPEADNSPAGIVLMRFPTAAEVTLMVTVHEPGVDPVCGGTVPPLKDNVVDPATALTDPPQVLISPTGLAITRPAWTPIKLSVQEALVNGKAFGLKIETCRLAVPPAGMDIGEKLLFISAGKVRP